MKRLLASFTILSFVTCYARIAGAAVFIGPGINNGDLDLIAVGDQLSAAPSPSWHVNSSKTISGTFNDGAASASFANVQQPGGFGLAFKPFQGNLATGDRVTASVFQSFGIGPGATYTFTGWAGAEPNYVGLSDPTVKSEFAIEFRNIANTLIGSAVLDLRTGLSSGLALNGPQPALAAPNGNAFNYRQYTLTAVSPPQTNALAVHAMMGNAYANPAGGDQAFVVDAFTFSNAIVPEPSATASALIGITGLLSLVRWRQIDRK